ncbi:MAG: histone family protein [Candidatus Nitrosoabyssus spongiisocia]|nr:MAG: histone family protein [Nitrosopumilaceae archaeon AB1(1)]
MASDFSILPMFRILKKAGANRVSDEATDELRNVIDEVSANVAKRTVELATHAGRKTVKAEDVKIAFKQLLKS